MNNVKDYPNNSIKRYQMGECIVLVSKDHGKLHLSISHPDRLPNYEEIKFARYHYLPDSVYMAQIFPPKAEFVNLHPNCLHLWQL